MLSYSHELPEETISCYKLCDVGSSEEVRLVYLEQRGEAMVLAGVASIRLGDQKTGRPFIMDGIDILESVRTNSQAPEALRSMATKALQFAKQQQLGIK